MTDGKRSVPTVRDPWSPTHQQGCVVVDALEGRGQRNLLNAEGDPREAELACNVHAADLHVHGHDLHGTHTPAVETRPSEHCWGPLSNGLWVLGADTQT